MTRSSQHVFAFASARQAWQRAQLLVPGRDGAHAGGSAAEDAVLSRGVEQFGAGALAEDDCSFQRAGRSAAAKAVSVRGRAAGRRSAGSARTAEQSASGAHSPVRLLLAGPAVVEATRVGSLFRSDYRRARGRRALVAPMWVAKSLVTLQAALCSYRHDGSRLRAYLFFQPRSATVCPHAQTPLRCAPVSACAGRAACSRRGPDPFRRPLVTYQWSQRSALGRGLRVPPSAGGLARCTAQRKATRSGQVG